MGFVMLRKFAFAAGLGLAFTAPASAITVKFVSGATGMPSWTTASYIQEFEQPTSAQFGTGGFDTGETNLLGTETVSTGSGGSIRVVNPSSSFFETNEAITGNFLRLGNASYTLTFAARQQFVGFLLQDFVPTYNRVTINGSSTNLLSGLAGLTSGADGLVYIDMGGATGISSITFASTHSDNSRRFQIDQIASAAPEASTWGMMILGFGVVGMQMRRRRAGPSGEAPALA